MRKILVLSSPWAIGAMAVAISSTANARPWGHGWGWGPGPFVGALVVSAALAAPYYDY